MPTPMYSTDFPASGSFGGMSYQPNVGKQFLQQLFGQAGEFVTAGSRGAEGLLRDAYDKLFTTRAEGIVGGQRQFERGLGALSASQGYSPEMTGLLSESARAESIRGLGEARAQGESELDMLLAELLKGTGTELAGLSIAEAQSVLQNFLASKARSIARKGQKYDLWGAAIGAAGEIGGGLAAQ